MNEAVQWLRETIPWGWVLVGSLFMFVGSLALLPLLVIRMPADYFARNGKTDPPTKSVGARLSLAILRNGFGALFLASGLVMLVTPGQGILFILMGLALLDFPGKAALIQHAAEQKSVMRALNKIRRKAGHEPFQTHAPDANASDSQAGD